MAQDPYHISLAEFDILPETLGSGSYSEIILAKHKRTGIQYAMKIVNKEKAQRHNNVKYFVNERRLMVALKGAPRIIQLLWTTKDEQNIYFIYEKADLGELWEVLRGFPPTYVPPVEIRKIWISQIVSALEIVNVTHNIAHRDLKPENILLDGQGNIKLCDFGTAKLMRKDLLDAEYKAYLQAVEAATVRVDATERQRALAKLPTLSGPDVLSADENRRRSILYQASRNNSFTGTPHYMSPETIQTKGTRGTAGDLWSLGVCIYQLECGELPFQHDSPYAVLNEVVEFKIDISKIENLLARDLILKLLVRDPSYRLGVYSYDHNTITMESIEAQTSIIAQLKQLHDDLEHEDDKMFHPDIDPLTKKRRPKLLSETTVSATQEGYESLKTHPYFSTFFQSNTNPDSLYNWNCDLTPEMTKIVRHARDICYNYISYTDEDGNPAEHPKQKTHALLEKEKKEIEKMEAALNADFPLVKEDLISPDEDDKLDAKLQKERKFAAEEAQSPFIHEEQEDEESGNYSDDEAVNEIINQRWKQ